MNTRAAGLDDPEFGGELANPQKRDEIANSRQDSIDIGPRRRRLMNLRTGSTIATSSPGVDGLRAQTTPAGHGTTAFADFSCTGRIR
jgi:hypothetical protein